MQTRRILRGRTLPLALGTLLVLAACADAPPTAPAAFVPPRAPGRLIGTAPGQIAGHTIAAGGQASLAVRPDGAVAAWGNNGFGNDPATAPLGDDVPPGLSGVVSLASFGDHVVALRGDGSVAAWGANRFGQVNVPPLNGVVAVAAGAIHSLALRNDGTVAAWGANHWGQSSVPAGLSNVVAVDAGQEHSLAVRGDGTVVAWGRNDVGQAAPPAGLGGVAAVAGARRHSVALRGDGTVVAWGHPAYTGVPAGLSGVIAVAAGLLHTVALKRDGTVVEWDQYGPRYVPAGLSNVVAIDAGNDHTIALRSDGTVVAWGFNGYGQTAVPAGLVARVPNAHLSAGGIMHPAGIVSGRRYTFAVAATDAYGGALAYAWDMNADGTPEQESGLAGIYYGFSAGGTHTVRVTITDARGVAVQRSATFTVEQNVAPQATINAIPTVPEGTVVYPRALVTDANSATDPIELKYLAYRWDFGDGTTSTNATPSKRYNDNGTYPVTLTVKDRGGAFSTTRSQVQVTNAPPRARLVMPSSVLAFDVFALQASSVTDPGLHDRGALEVAFDCGEGYYPYTRSFATGVSCVAARPAGSRLTVGLRVRDKDGAVMEYTRTYVLK